MTYCLTKTLGVKFQWGDYLLSGSGVNDSHTCHRFRTDQGHCGACRRKWRLTDTDLCPCAETMTMSHIVESCPLTKLNGSLSRLHSADEDAVSWLTRYGSWNAYEKKKTQVIVISLFVVCGPKWLKCGSITEAEQSRVCCSVEIEWNVTARFTYGW